MYNKKYIEENKLKNSNGLLEFSGNEYDMFYHCNSCSTYFESRSSHKCLQLQSSNSRMAPTMVLFPRPMILLEELSHEEKTSKTNLGKVSKSAEIDIQEHITRIKQDSEESMECYEADSTETETGTVITTSSESNVISDVDRYNSDYLVESSSQSGSQVKHGLEEQIFEEDDKEEEEEDRDEVTIGEDEEDERDDSPQLEPLSQSKTVARNLRPQNISNSPSSLSSTANPTSQTTPYVPKYAKPKNTKKHAVNEAKLAKGIFQCACKMKFNHRGRLTEHIRYYTWDPKFQCPRCPLRFIQLAILKGHVISAHKDRLPEGTIGCGDCGEIFTDKEAHKAHRLTMHMRYMEVYSKEHAVDLHSINKNIFRCVCELTFTRMNNLLAHVRSYTNQHEFQCELCQRCFRSHGRLRSHFRTVHKITNPDKNTLGCGLCGETFRSRSRKQLQTHMLKSHGVLSYKQQLPGEASATKHGPVPARTGRVEVVFRCLCGKTFPTRKTMTAHFNRVQNSVPFRCPHCPDSAEFSCHSRLAQHIRRVHNLKDYKSFGCQRCGTIWSTRVALRRHQDSTHSMGKRKIQA